MRHIDIKWFREILRSRKMSQAALSKAIHMNPSSVSLTLSGKREIRLGEAQRIAKALDLPIEELVRHFGSPEEAKPAIVKFAIVPQRKRRRRVHGTLL